MMYWISLLLLTVFAAICIAQPNFTSYATVDEFQCRFSDSELPPLERILLTQRCGEIISACFPDPYPAEIPDGYEIWDLNSGSLGTVLGYRFVINFFEAPTGNLDISSTLAFDSMTNINSIPPIIRNITLTGSASGSGVEVDFLVGSDLSLSVGEDFSITEPRLYLTFESGRDTPGMGFNISYCADLDDCASSPCPSEATCTDTVDGFMCVCQTGFTSDGANACVDIDECTANPASCNTNALCTNTAGSFTCSCNSGYTGNGITCTDIDECTAGTDNCDDTLAICANTVGSFTCTCRTGYTGIGTTGNCADIDECASSADNCDNNAQCTNNLGSFTCACNTGYTGDGVTCTDVDECGMNTDNCDDTNGACSNTIGSFTCSCNSGFNGNGVTCTDRDECTDGSNNCNLNANCANTPGSFTCTCRTGFTGDGTTCNDINECSNSADNNCNAAATCTNTAGSFTCACNPGFTGNGVNCADVNECDSNPCDPNAACTDIPGSFQCACNPGYSGDGLTCTDIDECAMNASLCNATVRERCRNTAGSFMCICDEPTYRGPDRDNCAFYCQGFNRSGIADCEIDGFLEWPFPNDEIATYERNQVVSWNVTLTATNIMAIRFTFQRMALATPQDYIIFSNSDIARRGEASELAVFSGTSLNAITNLGNTASSSNPVNYNPDTRTFIVNQAQVFVHFISDRNGAVDTGFVIAYERDVQNCPAINPCQNGGTCQDQAFTYTCTDCPGFTGQNCSVDVDECTAGTSTCSNDAVCSNTGGGFTCACNSGFTGNGTICNPLITLSDLSVQTSAQDASTSVLTVNFSLTEIWRTDPNYVLNYTITLENLDTSNSRNVTTNFVNSTNFLPFTFEVMPFNRYRVSVLVGETGSSYDSENTEFEISGDMFIEITSATIAPLPITDLMTVVVNSYMFQITWTDPVQTDRGQTTGFEVSYVRSDADCSFFSSLEADQPDCSEVFVNITTNNKPFVIYGLQQYRDYQVRIRAYTSFGAGSWSNILEEFTGDECSFSSDRSTARTTPCNFERAALRSPAFPNPPVNFDDQFAQVNFTGRQEFRLFTDFFSLGVNDFLDVGPGPLPVAPDLLEQAAGVDMLTGSFSRGQNVVNITESAGSGMAFAGYKRDRLSTASGFLVYYETNATRCNPDPCANGGTCVAADFDFNCQCTSGWGGKVCNIPMVSILTTSCSAASTSSFTLTWTVNPDWNGDASVFTGIEINHSGLSSAVVLSTTTTTYTADNFSPYELVVVSIRGVGGTAAGLYPVSMQNCRTAEAPSEPPASVNVTSDRVDTGFVSTIDITVTWTAPTVPNGMISGYVVSYTELNTVSPLTGSDDTSSSTFTAQFTGLKPFTQYSVSVTAVNGAGNGVPRTEPFDTPEGLPQTAVGSLTSLFTARTATLTFSPPAVTTGNFLYVVSYTPDNGNSPIIENSSPIVVSGLTPATSYTFTVVARTSAGDGPANTTTGNTLEDIPGPIGDLTLNPATFDTIECSWSAPAEPNGVITGYRVEWAATSGGASTSVAVTTTSFTIPSLSALTQYTVTVYASTNIGEGNGISDTTTTIAGPPQGPVQDLTIAAERDNATITIVDPAVVTGPFTFDIVYFPVDMPSQTVELTGQSSPVAITGLSPNVMYNVTVYPRSAGVRGNFPATRTFMTNMNAPSVVQSLQVASFTATSVTLTWQEPAENNGAAIASYTVSWTPGGGSTSVTTPGATIDSLSPFTNYEFSVVATNSGGTSLAETVSQRTAESTPTTVTNLAAALNNDNSMTITFDPPAPANGIILFYSISVQIANREMCVSLYNDSTCDASASTEIAANEARTFTTPVLPAFRTFEVAVVANTSIGNGPSATVTLTTSVVAPGTITNVVAIATSDTTADVSWSAPTPVTGPSVTYTVTVTSLGTSEVTTETITSEETVVAIALTGLNPEFGYTIAVLGANSGGSSATASGELARIPRVITVGVYPALSSSTALLGDGTPFSSFNIENPCDRSAEFFNATAGTIRFIRVIIRQEGSDSSLDSVRWAQSIRNDPYLLRPFITAEISCLPSAGNRKKRQLSNDRTFYTVGADSSCSENDNSICNGALPSDRRYIFAYQGATLAGLSELTLYGPISAPFPITRSPRDALLQPGEIAAIVISSVIAFLLVVLLIVYIVQKRNSHGSHNVSKAGRENPVYAQVTKPSPAIEMSSESTSYSEQTKQTST